MPARSRTGRGERRTRIYSTQKHRGVGGSSLRWRPIRRISLKPTRRDKLIGLLEDLYRNDPDAGVHAAAELVLTRLGRSELPQLEIGPPQPDAVARHRWYVSKAGHTMVRIEGPVEFTMGSPFSEPGRQKHEVMHRRIIPRRFAIASREVTVDQFQRFAHGETRITSRI